MLKIKYFSMYKVREIFGRNFVEILVVLVGGMVTRVDFIETKPTNSMALR